eukprot:COSAG05_NODE_13751_length_419_cov_0.753125_1_plen_53_part_10
MQSSAALLMTGWPMIMLRPAAMACSAMLLPLLLFAGSSADSGCFLTQQPGVPV